jgi:hypothetical protein
VVYARRYLWQYELTFRAESNNFYTGDLIAAVLLP